MKAQKLQSKVAILSSSYSFPSANLLRNALKEKGLDIGVTSKPARLNANPIIRYGNSVHTGFSGEDTRMNSPEFIRLLSYKKSFSDLLLKSGFYSPNFRRLSPGCFPESFPTVVRETLSSAGGKGIHVLRNKEEVQPFLNSGYFFTEYVPTQYELRAHIFNGEIIKLFKKLHEGANEEEFPIRNLHRGYHFSLVNIELYGKLRMIIAEIQKLLPEGATFYALDVAWDSENKRYFIFEGNSAPGLNENTASAYADKILKTLGERNNA